jgi:hypothetical protein
MCLEKALHAQYVYTIKADSVKITNTCDTAELIIENHTQTVPGFLFNRGRGRTEFRRIAQLDDTSVVVGGDTIHLGRGNRNFANADLTFDGDHWHDGALHEGGLYNFNQIGFQVNDADFNNNADMSLSQNNGYLLYMSKYTPDNRSFKTKQKVGYGNISLFVDNHDNGNSSQTGMDLYGSRWGFYSSYLNSNTGETYNGGISYDFELDDNRSDMHLGVSNGSILIQTGDRRPGVDKNLAMLLNNADSITFYAISWPDTITRFKQTREGFTFNRLGNNNDFRIAGLPSSTSSTDSMLVVDNNGQVKKRAQTATRKSATVTADSYTVPADVDVVFVNYAGGTATITLPSGTLDREITIKNLNTTNSVALSGLDASESNTIATRGAITVKYTGSAWVGISKY